MGGDELQKESRAESAERAATSDPEKNLICQAGDHKDARETLAQERTRTAQATERHLPKVDVVGTTETLKDGTVVHKDAKGHPVEVDYKDGRIARMTYDQTGKLEKCMVKGPDGKEREYVGSDKQVALPGPPGRWPLDGGVIDNQSDRPVLAVGDGVGHKGNSHGDPYLRLVPPHTKTDGGKYDFDGIITDKNYQPVVLPDGKTFMPAKVEPDADWLKVPDRNTGVVTNKETRVDTPMLPPYGDPGMRKLKDYSGNRAVTPESKETRDRDLKNQ